MFVACRLRFVVYCLMRVVVQCSLFVVRYGFCFGVWCLAVGFGRSAVAVPRLLRVVRCRLFVVYYLLFVSRFLVVCRWSLIVVVFC